MSYHYEVEVRLFQSENINFLCEGMDQAINDAIIRCNLRNKGSISIDDYEVLNKSHCNFYITSEDELDNCRFLKSFSQCLVRDYGFERTAKGLLECNLVECPEPVTRRSSVEDDLSRDDVVLLKINRLWFSSLPDDIALKRKIIALLDNNNEEPF